MSSIYDWSTTAANNATADADIDWSEGQLPSTVNNSAREMMAKLAHFRNDLSSVLVTGGTGDDYTVSPGKPPTDLTNGWVGIVRFDRANTGAATMQVGGLPATPASLVDAEGNALPSGFIAANGIYLVTYNPTTGNFHIVSKIDTSDHVIGPASATDSNLVAFDGTTGKFIKDSGFALSSLIASPGAATIGNIAAFNDATGNSLIDGGLSYSGLWHDNNFASKIAALTQNTSPAGTESVACDDGQRVTIDSIREFAREPDFASGALTLPTPSRTISVAHGLGVQPRLVSVFIECKVTTLPGGYSLGDRFVIGHHFLNGESGIIVTDTIVGYSVYYNSIKITYKDGSGAFAPSATDWDMYIFAWK